MCYSSTTICYFRGWCSGWFDDVVAVFSSSFPPPVSLCSPQRYFLVSILWLNWYDHSCCLSSKLSFSSWGLLFKILLWKHHCFAELLIFVYQQVCVSSSPDQPMRAHIWLGAFMCSRAAKTVVQSEVIKNNFYRPPFQKNYDILHRHSCLMICILRWVSEHHCLLMLCDSSPVRLSLQHMNAFTNYLPF